MKYFKALLCAVLILIASASTIYAQQTGFGLKAGMNFSNFGGDDAGTWDSRTGFSLGGFPVRENIIGLEVRYNLGLTSFDDSDDNFSIKHNVVMVMILLQI